MKTLKSHCLFTFYLFIVFVSLVIGPSVLASQRLNITVETSKASYLAEENIEVYGKLTYDGSPVPERLVSLEVQNPSGSPVVIRNLETDINGTYNLTFKLASDASLGTYTVYVSSSYKGETATNNTIFELYVPSTRYPWSMFRHNLRHTSYTESPAPNTNQTLWNYTTGGGVYSSPAVADGMLFVGSYDGNVYALDQHTGSHIWNYTTGGGVYSSPAVADGKVFVGSYDAKVYCLDVATGAHVWNYTTGWAVHSSPAVSGGKVYVGSFDGKVYCLRASDGFKEWEFTTGDGVISSPAVSGGKVYVGSFDGKVYCLDVATGSHIWNYTTGGGVYSSPAVADGKVFVGSYDAKVYCLDVATGAHIWNYTTQDWVYSSPAVADGKVFVGSYDAKVYCLDVATGAHIWNYTTGGPVLSSPAVADGMVFVGSNNHIVYAFGNVVRVPEDYPTVPEAVKAADPGATITIAPGTHYDPLIIDKPLTILGKTGSATEFDGGGSGIALILLPGASGSTVAGIVITNWDQGICIVDAGDCKVYDNIMSLMDDSGIVLEGDDAANNLIYSNIFEDNTIAINLTESATNNTIYKNIISSSDIGLKIESDGNIIYANTISNNDIGIDASNSNNNVIYHNNFIDNNIENARSEESINVWDNGYPSGGNYWTDHEPIDEFSGPNQDQPGSDGIIDANYTIATNNVDRYPLVEPFSPHDIGITNVVKSKTVVGQGFTLLIDLKILNYGTYEETFTVTAYANTKIIATQTITLTTRNSTTITFEWNTSGFAKGNYTISAVASAVPDETYTDDNTFTDDWVIVAMVGDITGPDGWPDGKCDMRDIGLVARHFGKTVPPAPANCDITGPTTGVPDGKIDMRDIGLTARHFGEKDP